jgi:hypothetical protein
MQFTRAKVNNIFSVILNKHLLKGHNHITDWLPCCVFRGIPFTKFSLLNHRIFLTQKTISMNNAKSSRVNLREIYYSFDANADSCFYGFRNA